MKHIQGYAIYRPRTKKGKSQRGEAVRVVVVAHSKDGYSTILFPDGKQVRVSTNSLEMER